jgi:MFS superfamily sulfate permease-like transporter
MTDHAAPHAVAGTDQPRGDATGFRRYFRADITSGFFVFLIALPLCLGISQASGFPPVAGVFTAVVGALITSLVSNSELTIKGPAAGLIVIVLGAMQSFGFTAGTDPAADARAYRLTLAVGVVAAVVQIAFGLLKAGALGAFFPTAVVHGMLAAIGVIICLKQLPVVFGQKATGEPLEILAELPEKILHMNPRITVIGVVSLAILFGFPWVKKWLRPAWLQRLPAQLVVLAVAVPLAAWFDLATAHTYSFLGHEYALNESFLVSVPGNLAQAVTAPDFTAFTTPATRLTAVWWVAMFALVGSIESMLSAKAIDLLDPWKRKTQLNRDLLGVGLANLVAAGIGGLPMISEIVRSKANIDNGGRTRFADMWHGLFLLAFVALLPGLIHRIPLAALAAMLVYTGLRLASPREFINVFKIGAEQLLIFVTTIIGVLATDLLVGVGIGIGVKFLIHAINGVPLRSFFKPFLDVTTLDDHTVQIDARGSAVFSNWIPFRRQIEQLGLVQGNDVVVNLAGTRIVDHSVMEGLHELSLDFQQAGRRLDVVGLEGHRQSSAHPYATRKRGMVRLKRVTAVTEAALEREIVACFLGHGASGYTAIRCHGAGRRHADDTAGGDTAGAGAPAGGEPLVRLEAIVPADAAERILDDLLGRFAVSHRLTACVETVDVLRREQF